MFENAKWINDGNLIITKATSYQSPAKEFRKVFEVNAEFKKATISICGLGYYKLYINKEKVGDDVLSPLYSQYDKHAYYVTYDISKYLKQGKNVLCVILGDGFFNETVEDTWCFFNATFRECPKLIFDLRLDDKEYLVSDTTIKARNSKVFYHQAERSGEYYDASKIDNWMDLDFDDNDFHSTMLSRPIGTLVETKMPLIKETELNKPVSVFKSKEGYILDFGKNLSGYVGFSLKSKKGNTVTLTYAEKLKDNELDQSNIDLYVKNHYHFSRDSYTFGSDEVETYHTSFCYHGFRYCEVIGLDEINMNDFTQYFVHTDFNKLGTFKTSDDFLSWFYDASVRSFLSNYHSIPTDCPHREKNGWTGDASLSSDYAVYLYDMKEAYKKYMQDIIDTQLVSGQVCSIAPTAGWGYNWGSGPAWDSALFNIPYALYLETGNEECFDVMYEAGKKYLEYARYYRNNGLVLYGLGDWCPPEKVDRNILKIMSNELSDSCYYYKIQKIMAFIANLKGDKELAKKIEEEALETKNGILKKYVHGDNVDNNGIGALSAVIYFEIVEGEQKEAIGKHLVKVIEECGYKSYVGILGMKAVLNALPMINRNDVAYKFLTQKEYPSYNSMREKGATTIWETFEGESYASYNHHMYNEPLNYMIRNIAGLKNKGIAYDEFVVEPYIYASEASASTEKLTEKGLIKVDWKYENHKFTCLITKPNELKGKLLINNQEYVLENENNFELEF